MWKIFLISIFSILYKPDPTPKPINLGNLLISIPTDATDKDYPMLIMFGGSMWATPKFMWDNTPRDFFQKAILVYSPCYTHGGGNLKKVETELISYLQRKGITYKGKSVCGYSGGGPDAMIAENPKNYMALGFIDPTPVANGTVRYSSNMILSFRRNNWIYSDFYGKCVNFKDFNELSDRIRRAGGIVEEADVQHEAYFRYFLDKFRKQLIGG